MSDKTSHRRKHRKTRDPMAQELENPIFRQRRVERKRRDKERFVNYVDEEDEEIA